MTARTRNAKKPAAKRPAKPGTRKAATPTTVTVVDVREPLPVRRSITGPHTHAQLAEARAALASATAGLPIPHILWLTQIDGRACAHLADGTYLVHTHERAPEFTAYTRCPTGGLHTHLVTNPHDLKAARALTGTCSRRHDDTDGNGPYDWHKAVSRGIQTLVPARLSPLNTGLQAAKKATAKTQPLDLHQIAAGLEARAAAETAKEHPQP